MNLDHITYHVESGTLERRDLLTFFRMLGMEEVPADDRYEHGWYVRWFASVPVPGDLYRLPYIHLIETEESDDHDRLALGHFCIQGDVDYLRNHPRAGDYIKRDSGSGRIWLQFANLRVEVRP